MGVILSSTQIAGCGLPGGPRSRAACGGYDTVCASVFRLVAVLVRLVADQAVALQRVPDGLGHGAQAALRLVVAVLAHAQFDAVIDLEVVPGFRTCRQLRLARGR